ncbi:glutathione S-transferase family protein [Alishewanella sp. HL-SH06]|uniref:glutathione S-transferase family protein n=1 Tax=Alishewanella sp. HL-SH06 TaxID=3461144 RepID=UPI004042A27E
MKLYGSQTSPYVRRIRLLLAAQPYEFVDMQIFAEGDREKLLALNPTLKVPMFEHDGQMVFDSGVIYRYLTTVLSLPALSWYQENQLTVINAINDSLVTLFLSARSGLDTNEDRLFFNVQKQRIAASMFVLEQQAQNHEFAEWNYIAMSLYSLLDWVIFRELLELDEYPALQAFYAENKQQAAIAITDPRLT